MKRKRWKNANPFVQSTAKNYRRAVCGPWYGSAVLEQQYSSAASSWNTLHTRSGTVFSDSAAAQLERDARDLENVPPLRVSKQDLEGGGSPAVEPEELTSSSSHDEKDGLIIHVQK
jgi:hypothetical protein